MPDVLERLAHVEDKQPLEFEQIDFTVRDPEAVRRALADPLAYAQRVEAVVAALGIDTLLPRQDERVRRFLDVWTVDEVGHGVALAELLRRLDLEPVVVERATQPPHNHLVGLAGRLSHRMHEVVEAIWATSGTMNEHLAMTAYNRMDAILVESGERALHETLFRVLRAHESAHKSFYAAYAGEVLARLRPWQRRLARLVVRATYTPVGAGASRDRPAFGRTVVALAGDQWETKLVEPLQRIAERLLAEGREMDPFVRRAVYRCLQAGLPSGGQPGLDMCATDMP